MNPDKEQCACPASRLASRREACTPCSPSLLLNGGIPKTPLPRQLTPPNLRSKSSSPDMTSALALSLSLLIYASSSLHVAGESTPCKLKHPFSLSIPCHRGPAWRRVVHGRGAREDRRKDGQKACQFWMRSRRMDRRIVVQNWVDRHQRGMHTWTIVRAQAAGGDMNLERGRDREFVGLPVHAQNFSREGLHRLDTILFADEILALVNRHALRNIRGRSRSSQRAVCQGQKTSCAGTHARTCTTTTAHTRIRK